MAAEVTQEQRFIAVALVRDEQGRILVQRRIDKMHHGADGKWEFPGGSVEFGETPECAAVRETLEETGVLVAAQRLLPAIQSRVWHRADGSQAHTLVVCFECRPLAGKAEPQDEYVSEVAWRTPQEIATLDCLDGIPVFLAASIERLTR